MNNKEKLEQLMEALVGDNAMQRYTHKEILAYAYDLKDKEQQVNDNIHTYIYGYECPEVWTSLGFHLHDNDDRIKLQFVKYQARGSYDE